MTTSGSTGRRSRSRCGQRSQRTCAPSVSPCVSRPSSSATIPRRTSMSAGSKSSHEAGSSRRHRFPSDTPESESRAHRRAERRRRRRRDPRPASATRAHGRAEVLRAVDPAKDVDGFHSERGRLSSGSRSSCPPRRSGVMAMLADTASSSREGSRRDRTERDRRQADGDAPPAEHATVTICHSRTPISRATRGAPTSSLRRSAAGARHAGHGQAGCDGDRRRRQPHRGGKLVGDVDPPCSTWRGS